MQYLYTPQAAARHHRQANRARLAMWLTGGLSLLACIVMCTQVNTANARALLLAVIGLSTLAGWTVILLLNFMYLPAKRRAEHMRSMLEEETECFQGRLSLMPMRFAIPRSIVIQKAKIAVEGEEEPVSLSVDAYLAGKLPTGGGIRVLTARRYIIAFERCEVDA